MKYPTLEAWFDRVEEERGIPTDCDEVADAYLESARSHVDQLLALCRAQANLLEAIEDESLQKIKAASAYLFELHYDIGISAKRDSART